MNSRFETGTGTEPKKLVPEPEPFNMLEREPKYEKNLEPQPIQNL